MEKKANGYSVSNPEVFVAMLNKNPIFKIFKIIDKDRTHAETTVWVTFVVSPDERPVIKTVGTDEVLGKAISIKVNDDNSLMVLLTDRTVYMIEPFASIKRKNLVKKPAAPAKKPFNKNTKPNNNTKKPFHPKKK